MGFWPVDSVHKKENNLNYYPRRPTGGTGVIISSLLTCFLMFSFSFFSFLLKVEIELETSTSLEQISAPVT